MPLRLVLALLCLWVVESEASSELRLVVDPPLRSVRPNHDEARLALLPDAHAAVQKTVHWNLVIQLPPRGFLFSTDFPRIEGKRLLEIDFFTVGEEARWSMVFPIRGRYEVRVKTEVDGEAPKETSFPLDIREAPIRLVYLALSLAGVFALGCLMGWATSGSRVIHALWLLPFVGVAAPAQLDIPSARVGEIAPLNLNLPDWGNNRIDLSIVKTEDRQRLFHIEDVAVRGKAAWHYHFFDGSPHQVRMTIRHGDTTSLALVERNVIVEASEPPRKVVMVTYGIFLLPLAAGWLVGRSVKKRKKPRKISVPSV